MVLLLWVSTPVLAQEYIRDEEPIRVSPSSGYAYGTDLRRLDPLT
jgi:hypothetical protein